MCGGWRQCHGTTEIFTWIDSGTFELSWALKVDTLTAVMLAIVTVSIVSCHDPHLLDRLHERTTSRSRASWPISASFTFFMLMLVTADNFVQMFFGWEGRRPGLLPPDRLLVRAAVGLRGAIKAFLVNRVGDVGFALGIMAYCFVLSARSASIRSLRRAVPNFADSQFVFIGIEGHALTITVHPAVHRRHGQIGAASAAHLAAGRHGRPDAGLRPDPRRHHGDGGRLHGLPPVADVRVCADDRARAGHLRRRDHRLLRGDRRACQNDIKRVIAYSTCSQLGYMFFAAGVSAYGAAIFHLGTHAFFKALLFLGAGSVIHAVSDEQDMRKMGGLCKRMIPKPTG